ncbi:hypothetical protein AAFF_G00052320 [Aldrovandia affinis]|uniref:Uncharacterized protein n=1 Tax=Aldrovandia affinis TaxID=143900 RepID=A0AAD7T4M2_9TELE|nr:hypothetical protein AAFF_G00052320 [Aldrovandia affinis]
MYLSLPDASACSLVMIQNWISTVWAGEDCTVSALINFSSRLFPRANAGLGRLPLLSRIAAVFECGEHDRGSPRGFCVRQISSLCCDVTLHKVKTPVRGAH